MLNKFKNVEIFIEFFPESIHCFSIFKIYSVNIFNLFFKQVQLFSSNKFFFL